MAMPLWPRRVIALDTETTGFSPELHRIVEIGAVEIDPRNGTLGAHLHEVLNPLQPIPWGTTRVHGLSDRDVRNKPHFGTLAPTIVEFLRGATLAIHNSRFDVAMLDAEFERHGFPKLAHCDVEVVDTLAVARELLPALPSHKLDSVCDALGVDRSSRLKHGALLDAQLVAGALLPLSHAYDDCFGSGSNCGQDGPSIATAIANAVDEELARIDGGTIEALEVSFCRIARILTFARHCRLELLGRWEADVALDLWSCVHFATSVKSSSYLSYAAAAKGLLGTHDLRDYSKRPVTSRTVTALTEDDLDERFTALGLALRTARYSRHALARDVLALEKVSDALARSRDDLRARILETPDPRGLRHVVVTSQTRASVDYRRALEERAPGADLSPYRTRSAPTRQFRKRDFAVCSALFGPPIRRAAAA